MDPRSLTFIATACSGALLPGSPEAMVTRVCTDSRQAQPGDLFFALAGEKFDGHKFVPEVAQRGVAAVVVERGQAPREAWPCAVITVENTRLALGRLAGRYRTDFDLPVVAVAGSNGKTTTKELLAAVLREKFPTLWSEASFNNDIGVPLTLLKLERAHRAAVLEVGTNHPGELAPLLRLIQPRFGVLTNIGREHLAFFGDLDGVAQEEGWLAELLPADGKLFANGDSEWTPRLARRGRAALVRVGFSEHNDWRAEHARLDAAGMTFQVRAPRREFDGEYRIGLMGRHQVPNALLALAAGTELGVSPDEARRGLAHCPPPKMRMQVREANGVKILDDAYNANADSMLAALETLRDLLCSGRRIAVLGDMAELGAHTLEAHEEVGRRAAECGVTHLLAVGQWARATLGAAQAAGLREARECADAAAAAGALRDLAKPGDVVLLKASRAAGFERISEALRAT